MSWNDDDVERALRALRPDDTGLAPDAAARIWASIEREGRPHTPARGRGRGPRRTWLITLAPVAATIASVIAAIVLLSATSIVVTPAPAAAQGLDPLDYQPLDSSVDDVVATARAQLAAVTDEGAPERYAHYIGWYADINAGQARLEGIYPEVTALAWNEDLSGVQTTIAGIPFSPTGAPLPSPTPAPGTLLGQTVFEAGQLSPRDTTPPSSDPAVITAQMAAFSRGEATRGAADHVLGLSSILQLWSIPADVHSATLAALASLGDLEVAGTTTDRAGRPVIGLHATSTATPWYDVTLLVSSETGRIVGVEQVYNGSDSALSITPQTVVSYTLWETE